MSTFAKRWIAGVVVATIGFVMAATAWRVAGGVLIFAGVLITPSSALTGKRLSQAYRRRRAAQSPR
jgi:hypothetical protein